MTRWFIIALLVLLCLSGYGRSQTLVGGHGNGVNLQRELSVSEACTHGPYTSPDTAPGLGTDVSVSALAGVINGAPPGSVICVKRGETWNFASGFLLSHSMNESIIVCATSSSSCDTAAAADPIFQLTTDTAPPGGGPASSLGSCIVAPPGTGGVHFKNIVCRGRTTALDSVALYLWRGSANITFESGHFDTWRSYYFSNRGSTSDPAPTNIKFGLPGKRQTWSGSVNVCHLGSYGSLDDSSFSIDARDINLTPVSCGAVSVAQFHLIDVSCDPCDDSAFPNGAISHDIEMIDTWFRSTLTGGGTHTKFAHGINLTVRDSIFEDCSLAPIAFASHGANNGWLGADVFRNRFQPPVGCTAYSGIIIQVGDSVDIYSNIVKVSDGTSSHGFVQFSCKGDPSGTNTPPHNARIFNNTVVRVGNSTGFPIIANDGPTSGTNCSVPAYQLENELVVNNVIVENDTIESLPWAVWGSGETCSDWGANGANVHDNFAWSENVTPGVTTCSAADWTAGGATSGDDGGGAAGSITGEHDEPPGLAGDGSGYTGDLMAAFTPTSSSSRVCGQGDPAYCALAPTYNGAARVTCDIGAIPCPP